MRDYDWKIITTLRKTHSITKAAELLYMSQPGLTKRIQIIEDDLGTKLLIRSQKGCEFTPLGQFVADKADIIVSTIGEIESTLSAERISSRNMIRLGGTLPFVQSRMPSIIAQLQSEFPQINLDFICAYSNDIAQHLEDLSIDIGFINMSPDSPYLVNELVGKNYIYAVYYKSFEIDELPNLPFIAYPKNPFTKGIIDKWWECNFMLPIATRYNVPTGKAAIEMVKNGLGFSIFPDLNYFQYEPNLYSIPLTQKDGTFICRPTYLSYNKNNPKLETIRKLSLFIRAFLAGQAL